VISRPDSGSCLSDSKDRKHKHTNIDQNERDVVKIVRQVPSIQRYANDKQKENVQKAPKQDKHQHVGEDRHRLESVAIVTKPGQVVPRHYLSYGNKRHKECIEDKRMEDPELEHTEETIPPRARWALNLDPVHTL